MGEPLVVSRSQRARNDKQTGERSRHVAIVDRTPLAEYPARRIALIKPSALGDIVHSLPVLTALRQRYPAAHIAWVVNRGYEPLLRGHRDLDETIPFDRHQRRAGVGGMVLRWMRFLSRLRNKRFDLVIDLQGLFRTALMVVASGARRRVGLSCAREGAARTYTDCLPGPGREEAHAVDRYWRVAEAFGARPDTLRFDVPVEPAALEWALRRLRERP